MSEIPDELVKVVENLVKGIATPEKKRVRFAADCKEQQEKAMSTKDKSEAEMQAKKLAELEAADQVGK